MFKTVASLAALTAAFAVAQADPQYMVVSLQPIGNINECQVFGAAAGQQVGNAHLVITPNFYGQPVLWTGTAASVVNLEPAGHEGGYANATDGTYQVGEVLDNGGGQTVIATAGMWQGSAASFVNMGPAGMYASWISAIDNGIEVGTARVAGGYYMAGTWTGPSAASWQPLPLPPLSNGNAYANGISGNIVVGGVDVLNNTHAFAWNIATHTSTDLNPNGFVWSDIAATDGAVYGGAAYQTVNFYHPGIWDPGTGLFTDLLPAGWSLGVVSAVRNGQQVGFVANDQYQSHNHAAVWSGSAGSFVDLNQFLPSSSVSSQAHGIDENGNIVGEYYDGQSYKGVMWVPLVQNPPPYTFLGFFSPLNDPAAPESSYKTGRTIPVKFSLLNSTGLPVINATATISLDLLSGNNATPVDPALFESGADNGTSFRFDEESDQYIYNLDAKNLAPGRYRVTATIADTGQTHSDTFTLTSGPGKGH